jgi:hypothetical protein
MRTAFKVATVFTGAAACAAAFAPAAGAATTAKTQLMEPGAFHKNCTGGSTRSVHFYYPMAADHGPTCVGEAGSTSLGGTHYSSVCTGNNNGFFLHSGLQYDFHRSQWIYFVSPPVQPVTKVYITGFSGVSKCPF